MKYSYDIKIHSVLDYNDLNEVMNKYGREGYRVSKAESIGHVFEKGRPMRKYVLYLEKKIKSK